MNQVGGLRVWIGGDGSGEIGDRDRRGSRVGAIEALLRRVQPRGWALIGATQWRHIRKFTVGAARGRGNHGDIHNIAGLVNQAFEAGCDVVAFSRDVDADDQRVDAVERGIVFATSIFPSIEIVGGPAIPALEGWILAFVGVRDTETMSRERANRELATRDLAGKRAEDYVKVVEASDLGRLPPGCDALTRWSERAQAVLGLAVGD